MTTTVEPNSVPVAIYTRKSTDAHVEQEIHSLLVQRASSESYAQSQQHLGWFVLPEKFDDNDSSGGTLKRPALERLKERIIEDKVKVVLINRLDRISRSLSQFLSLNEFFEKHGVALVSVTQNFNNAPACPSARAPEPTGSGAAKIMGGRNPASVGGSGSTSCPPGPAWLISTTIDPAGVEIMTGAEWVQADNKIQAASRFNCKLYLFTLRGFLPHAMVLCEQ